ncbi:MAG: non-canonical purine NTP pyrophosphatase, RdgB/HAM1 family [Flavobacteriales bacterium]|nr:non-canonical purine NTP pyrophosphatase, RdgB/HAM1 family [Flavobacteriales bacterium]|tara:strand:- start:56918 stop:57505 length:588 start_codon:yes stop_codon:yes gene_type:complete
MKQIVFSTHNENKLKEIKKILSDNFKILGLSDLNFDDEIIESGKTLAQNADIKASYINKLYNIDCFADDTGLEINSLNGEPGVYSARYAGDECSSEKNIEKVLNSLSNKKCRKAVFKTVICLVFNNEKYFFEGKVYGSILPKRIGKHGFGYDPIFVPDGFNKTFSQMSMNEKNRISHRAIAVEKLSKFLKSRVTK